MEYLKDLLNNFDKFYNINNIENESERGIIYESFIRLLILFNQFKNYELLNKDYHKILNKKEYLETYKINSSCKEGGCDFRLYNNKTNEYLLISCKYPNKEQILKYYDIDDLKTESEDLTINYKYGIFTKNKEEFIKKYNKSRNKNKKLIDLENVYDYNYFLNLLQNFKYNEKLLNNNIKLSLILKDYQINIINKIQEGNNLIGACPRSGKSYMIGGFIIKEQLNNILIITPIIKETRHQWKDDIFNKYNNFDDYNIISPLTGEELLNIKLTNKNIIIISKQLLQDNYNKFKYQPDLLVFDEHDFQGTTDISKNIINIYKSKYNIYLTATYYKSIINIPKLNIIKFDYKDLKQYNPNFPEPLYFTPRFEKDYFNFMKENKKSNYNIDFTTLFTIKNKKFYYKDKIIDFINKYISGNELYPNIHNIRQRISNYIRPNCIQIWFLPLDHINEISLNLKEILLNNDYYKNYEILCINSKNNTIDKLNEILNKPIKNKGKILLCGGMLQRGITIKKCDVVYILNNTESYSKYIQCIYRCLSEDKDKKYGVIVDFDLNRLLTLIINYEINNLSIEEKIKYICQNNLINFDPDMLETYNFDGNKSLENLLELWNKNPINQLNIFKKLIEDYYENIELGINEELLKIFKQIDIKNYNKLNNIIQQEELIKDDNIPYQDLKTQKEKLEKLKSEIEQKEKLRKEILPYIIPLSAVLTYNINENNFINCLNIINKNQILKEIFNSQCQIIWDKNELLELLIKIINNIDIDNNINNFISKIKYNINKLLDNPKELYNFINECIKIKSCEVEKHGEVMTPLWLIDEMINKLEEIDDNILKNPNTKIFDHSCGIGIFMICIYLKLKKYHTREHIIKNMLYFSEINKKNIFILKIIFGNNCNLYYGDTLTLNIKDYFKVNKFDIILGNPPYNSGCIRSSKKGKKIEGKYEKLWPKFINYSFNILKDNGYLIQIHPLTWMKKGNDCYNLLINKQIYYLELWNAGYTKKQFGGIAEIPVSWYILKNTKQYTSTIIKECNNRYNINNIEKIFIKNNISLPLAYINILYKIYDYIQQNNLQITYYNKTVMHYNKDYKENELSNNKLYGVKTYRINDGIIFNELKKEHEHQKFKKIIISNKRTFNGAFIDNGKYGLCGRGFYILDDDNKLELLLYSLNYKIYNLICKIIKYSQDFLDKEVFNYVIDIRKLKINNINEKILYNLIGFDDNEIKIINNF